MELPRDLSLPFFAYGLFKPGQLGFLRVRDHVSSIEDGCSVHGQLRERDGLPIIDCEGTGSVKGSLLWFIRDAAERAYARIVELEPGKQYQWRTVEVEGRSASANANVLFGRQPRRGSDPWEAPEWDGRSDPLFTSALEVVREVLTPNRAFDHSLKPLFRLQMGYLLLWSAIERYAALRYSLGTDVMKKLDKVGTEPAFLAAVRRHVKAPLSVVRADKPEEKKRLDAERPETALDFFYQVRSNMAHRGKAVVRDHALVLGSLEMLLHIFTETLTVAFEDARWPVATRAAE
jgi:hypothetical protein